MVRVGRDSDSILAIGSQGMVWSFPCRDGRKWEIGCDNRDSKDSKDSRNSKD